MLHLPVNPGPGGKNMIKDSPGVHVPKSPVDTLIKLQNIEKDFAAFVCRRKIDIRVPKCMPERPKERRAFARNPGPGGPEIKRPQHRLRMTIKHTAAQQIKFFSPEAEFRINRAYRSGVFPRVLFRQYLQKDE